MKELTRDRIIAAANRLIKEHSFAEFTLEKVAQEAGVSKGGLLHYFPNKDALVVGMLEYLHEEFVGCVEKKLSINGEVEPTPQMHVRAMAEASFETMEQDKGHLSGLIAAVATNPDLLESTRTQDEVWTKLFESTSDPVLATILGMAVDGMCTGELFGILNLDDDMKSKVKARILKMIDEELS